MKHIFCIFLSCFFVNSYVFSEVLTQENSITDKGKLKVDLGVAYANIDSQNLISGDSILVQTGTNSFVQIPVVGKEELNQDYLIGMLGLRYGLNDRAEIYVRTNYQYSQARGIDLNGSYTNSNDSRLNDVWIGLNYQISEENADSPAILAFGEVALAERYPDNFSYFQSVMVGLTTYKAIDPVLLSFNIAYRMSLVSTDDIAYKAGDFLTLSPVASFVVNDNITFNGGVKWMYKNTDQYGDQNISYNKTATDVLWGLTYAISKNNFFDFAVNTNISGQKGSNMNFTWVKQF